MFSTAHACIVYRNSGILFDPMTMKTFSIAIPPVILSFAKKLLNPASDMTGNKEVMAAAKVFKK